MFDFCSQFKIYFSNIHRLLQVNHDDFPQQHVTGDLTYITPTASFDGFAASSIIEVPIVKSIGLCKKLMSCQIGS
jgi:hexosaminidase